MVKLFVPMLVPVPNPVDDPVAKPPVDPPFISVPLVVFVPTNVRQSTPKASTVASGIALTPEAENRPRELSNC